MFKLIDALTGGTAKKSLFLYGALALALVFAALLTYALYQRGNAEKAKAEVAEQKVKQEKHNTAVTTITKEADVNAVVTDAKEGKALTDIFAEAEDAREAKLRELEAQYKAQKQASKPSKQVEGGKLSDTQTEPALEAVMARERERRFSEVQITASWEVFCKVAPYNPHCPTP